MKNWLIIIFSLVVTIGSAQVINILGFSTDLDCNAASGAPDGEVDITVTGGQPPYTYQWSNGSVDEDLSGLDAGTYTVTVTDANNEIEIADFTLTEPEPLDVVEVLDEPDCNVLSGLPDGGINIIAIGGTGTYTYNWSGPGVEVLRADQYGLGSGTYNLTVTDSNSCTVFASYTLTEPTPIIITSSVAPNGIIDIDVQGGTGPYTYRWTGRGVDIIGQDQSGLEAGTYGVTATDSNGCTGIAEFEVGSEGVLSRPHLCLVTQHSSGRNMLLWENPGSTNGLVKYHIYREGLVLGNYILIGKTAAVAPNLFIDSNVDPAVQAYKYYVTAVDIDEKETDPSSTHKTIHLTTSQGLSGEVNLHWSAYRGIQYNEVQVFRGTSSGNMSLLTRLSSDNSSFTDLNPVPGESYYQLVIPAQVDCNINRASYNITSNIANLGHVSNTEEIVTDFSIYPNPAKEIMYVDTDKEMELNLVDSYGRLLISRKVYPGKNAINTAELSPGIYFVKLDDGQQQLSKRIVITK